MPRPIDDVSPVSWSRLVGVAFDIDDTVTRDGRLEPEAYQAMHRLKAADLCLVAVTGRPLGWADVLAHMWPVDLAVGENGAGWAWRDGASVSYGYFDDERARRRGGGLLDQVRARVSRDMPDMSVAADQPLRRCDLAYDIGESVTLAEAEIDRLIRIIEDAGARSTVSSVHAHAVPGDWNKASGLVRAAREALDLDLDGDRDRWLFIGDSSNDAAAFDHFPLSVGVRNVEAHLARLPRPPVYITRAAHGGGFSEMAETLLRHRSAGTPGTR